MATVAEPPAEAPPGDRPADITAGEFFAMIRAGVFSPGRRMSLWGGRLCEKMAKTRAHSTTAMRIVRALASRLPADWLLSPENPVQLDDAHVPLPDFAFLRGPVEVYEDEDRHPRPEDVGLIVAVAVSSLPKELGERAERFARALIPSYWVFDVAGSRIVEHRDPIVLEGVGRYSLVRPLGRDAEIDLILGGRPIARIPVAELIR